MVMVVGAGAAGGSGHGALSRHHIFGSGLKFLFIPSYQAYHHNIHLGLRVVGTAAVNNE